MKRVNSSLVFSLLLIILIPSSISESTEIETSEVNAENSGYKSLQIRFSAVQDIEKYNVYFSKEKFNSSSSATLHSRIMVLEDISTLDKFSSEDSIAACWFSTDGSFESSSLQYSYKNDLGVPVIPSNSTNIVYNLVGLQTNVTYWFTVVAVNGEEEDIDVNNAFSASTEIQDVLPPSLDKTPIYLSIVLIILSVTGAFYYLSYNEKDSDNKLGYLYSYPAFLLLCILTFYPIFSGFYLSFTDSTSSKLGDEELVGFDNYIQVLSEGSFIRVTLTTLVWTITNVSAHVFIGLCLAMILNGDIYGKRVYRTVLLLPWAIPSFISVLVWRGMFQPSGLINQMLGIDSFDYFSSTSTALTIVILVNIWLGFPFMMMVFSGALQTIPKDLYEAAEIDGVSDFNQFKNITLPLLKPTLIPVSLLGFIWTFNMFNVIYLMTSGGPVVEIGGPGGSDILITYVYDLAFPGGYYGLAAAWSVIIFFMLLIFSFYYAQVSKSMEAST